MVQRLKRCRGIEAISRIQWMIHLDALIVSVPIGLQSSLHDTQKKYGFVLGPGNFNDDNGRRHQPLIMCE
jgi:hypothetical protein